MKKSLGPQGRPQNQDMSVMEPHVPPGLQETRLQSYEELDQARSRWGIPRAFKRGQ